MKNISKCGNYRLEIYQSSCFENPFIAWDGQPTIYTDNGYLNCKFEEKENLLDLLLSLVTLENMQDVYKVLNLATGNNLTPNVQLENLKEQIKRIDYIAFPHFGKLCKFLNIPYKYFISYGNSQGEQIQVIAALTPRFFKETGCNIADSDNILKGSQELFENWYSGKVYGFNTFKKVSYSKTNLSTGETSIVDEWEQLDSCGGFYGDNFATNGMCDYLPEELEEVAKNFDYNDIIY